MSRHLSLWCAGGLACLASVAFAWFVRLPLPFDGFAVAVAAVLAGCGTLTLVAWMPANWVWTDTEILRHAFRRQHGISDDTAANALDTITTVHQRAQTLRKAAKTMRADVAEQVGEGADRLDTAAREIFYEPSRHRDLRKVLIRSELIEDAARAHSELRKRNQDTTEQESRKNLLAALAAMDAAFDQTDLHVARGLLHEVKAASDVAEMLLNPRKATHTNTDVS